MKLLPSFLFLLFSISCFGQSVNQWHHFYTQKGPTDLSISGNSMVMVKAKGLLHYDLETQKNEHFNILTHPNMPTNNWSRVLKHPFKSDLWAVPNPQFVDFAGVYEYDGVDWQEHNLNELFSANFFYDRIQMSKDGEVLIPGRMGEIGIIAVYGADETWSIIELTTDQIRKVIGTINGNFYVLIESRDLLVYNAETEEVTTANLSELVRDIFPTGNPSASGIFILGGQNRVYSMEKVNEDPVLHMTSTDIPDVIFGDNTATTQDINGYFWTVGIQLTRFKKGEAVQFFPFPENVDISGRKRIIYTDDSGNAWVIVKGFSNGDKLWKCSPDKGLKSFDFEGAIDNTPLPLGFVPNEKFYFGGGGLKKYSNGEFESTTFESETESRNHPWIAIGEDGTAYYGAKNGIEYFRQKNDTSTPEKFEFIDESGESLLAAEIVSINESGDLLAINRAISSSGEGRTYFLKEHNKSEWRSLNINHSADFYGEDYLLSHGGYELTRFNFRTNSTEITPTAGIPAPSPIDFGGLGVKKDLNGQLWFLGAYGSSSYLGYMKNDAVVVVEKEELGLPTNLRFTSITPDNKGNIWVAYDEEASLLWGYEGVFLWDGETILKHFHPANSGLQFHPDFIYSDPLENLWMCYQGECTVYNENGVSFNYGALQPNFKTVDNGFKLNALPNPVSNILSICTEVEMTEIKIYDALGQLVFTEKINPTKTRNITVSEMVTGIYFCSVHSGERQETFKFVKR